MNIDSRSFSKKIICSIAIPFWFLIAEILHFSEFYVVKLFVIAEAEIDWGCWIREHVFLNFSFNEIWPKGVDKTLGECWLIDDSICPIFVLSKRSLIIEDRHHNHAIFKIWIKGLLAIVALFTLLEILITSEEWTIRCLENMITWESLYEQPIGICRLEKVSAEL